MFSRNFFFALVFFLMACSSGKFAVSTSKEVSFYKLERVDTLVDIGCGQGVFSKEIAHKYPNLFQVLEDLPQLVAHISTDSTKNKIVETKDELKRWLKKSQYLPNIEKKYLFIKGSEDSIPLATASCKRVLCRRTLHEFRNREKMVAELERILATDGVLTIAEVEPKYFGQIDSYCKNKYLTKQDILSQFKLLHLQSDTSISYPRAKMNVYNFEKQ